jgi:hypothetical protein
VVGGTELVLLVDIDPHISSYLFNLCVGFQARPNTAPPAVKGKQGAGEDKKDDGKDDPDVSKQIVRRNSRMGTMTPHGSRLGLGTQGTGGTQLSSTGFPINPLEPTEQQLELDQWHCSTATYDGGKITCLYGMDDGVGCRS